jgi:hypothetical protein
VGSIGVRVTPSRVIAHTKVTAKTSVVTQQMETPCALRETVDIQDAMAMLAITPLVVIIAAARRWDVRMSKTAVVARADARECVRHQVAFARMRDRAVLTLVVETSALTPNARDKLVVIRLLVRVPLRAARSAQGARATMGAIAVRMPAAVVDTVESAKSAPVCRSTCVKYAVDGSAVTVSRSKVIHRMGAANDFSPYEMYRIARKEYSRKEYC